MDAYSELCQIGKGACGSVYLVRHTDTKKLFALKKIQLDESRKTRTRQAVIREAKILAGLKHPHIVTYHDSFFDEKEEYLCIIQDYCDGGTLEDIIKEAAQRSCHLEEKEVVQIFLQIAMAVRYMHSKKVLHRDLKASNVFMNKSGTLCKIGDFGIAKSMDSLDVASTCVGTPCYLSPEMCQDIPYSSKADVWAMGCMLYEMLALQPAFDANNLVSLFYKIVKGEFNTLPAHYSDNMHTLVQSILVKSADERPSARGVLAIPFIKAELLRFIEEKEFLLEQQRLPTRQGSRPYSTPNLALHNRLASQSDQPTAGTVSISEAAAAAKRASSCRPNIVTRKERSILISAKPSVRTSRVTTIPEETEDQMTDKSRADADSKGDMDGKPGPEKDASPAVQKARAQGDQSPEAKTSPGRAVKNADAKRSDSPVVEEKSNVKSPKNKTNYAKMELAGLENGVKDQTDINGGGNQLKLELTLSPSYNNQSLDFREFESDPPKRHRIAEPMRTPRSLENHSLIIQTEPETPPIVATPTTKQPIRAVAETNNNNSKKVTQNVLNLDQPKPKMKREKKPQKSAKKNSTKTSKSDTSKKPVKSSGRRGNPKNTRPEMRDSLLEVPCEKLDYYSDDFDDSHGEDSDTYEEIPEEIPDWRRGSARSISLTQTFEIPEIEEDLPGGLVAEDEDDFNDFDDDDDIEEVLDEVVTVAKEACDDLDSPEVTDEVIVDHSERRPSTSKVIRNQCLNDLGRDNYDKVRKFFENNEEPELKKIERAIGKEHSKTIYLMTEIVRKKKLGHS